MKTIRYILIGFMFLIIIPIVVKLFGVILALVNGSSKNTDELLREIRGNAGILLLLFAVVIYLVNRNKKEKVISNTPPNTPNK